MDTALDIIRLVFGGVILYLGAEWLVKGSAGLARAFGVKPLIIGLTVVAYGTSAPELAVSSAAILKDSSALVMGNVIGSCIANLGLILGITALIAPPAVDGRLIRRELPVLLLSVAVVPVVMLGGGINRIEGALLIVGAIGFTIYTLFVSSEEDRNAATQETAMDEDATEANKLRLLVITLIGLAALVGGGELFVDGAKGIALAIGMDELLVGETVVAIGTSLPELAASLVAALRGYSSLAVGNVIGSNIFNVFLVFGVAGAIRPIDASLEKLGMRLVFLVGITLFAIFVMRGARRVTRVEGGFLFAAYAGFIVYVVIAALA